MRRLSMEAWAGLVMLVVAVAVSLPPLLVGVQPVIPRPLWGLLLLIALAGILAASVFDHVRGVAVAALAIAVTATWALILTMPTMGLLHVLVVVTAGASVTVVPLPASVVIIALNTAVVLLANLANAQRMSEALMLTGFYLLIQLASVFSTASLLQERRLRAELARAHVDLKAAGVLLAESARTAERLRISRELHDLIGHQLTVLTLNLEAAKHVGPDQAQDHMTKADDLARGLLTDVRSTVGHLRAESADIGTALSDIVDGIPGLDVEVQVDPELDLDEEQTTAVIRLVQEAVTNTIRHAQAEHLSIDVAHSGDEVVLTVTDDGIGASATQLGNGLHGLRERFEALGGTLAVEGRDGFRVTARMAAA